MRGASALQQVLDSVPGDLRVLVVWEPVIVTDIAPPTDRVLGLVHDGRAAQFWDERRLTSHAIIQAVASEPARFGLDGPLPADTVVWDTVMIFPPGVRWDDRFPAPAWHDEPVVLVARQIEERLRALAIPVERRW